MIRRCVLPAVAAGLLSLSSAFASLDPPGTNVARSKIEIGPWTFNPICTVDEHGGVIVQSMLAIADPSFTIGDNIVSVWYYRDGEDWASKAWTSQDPWEAIKALKLELDIPDEQDERWSAADWSAPGVGMGDPEPPSDYLKGLLASDPFAALVQASPDGDLLVSILADNGYTAADIPIDKDGDCTTADRLDRLTEIALDFYKHEDNGAALMIFTDDSYLCEPLYARPPRGPSIPRPPVPPGLLPPQSPPGTIPTAPAWTPGAWPIAPAWRCSPSPAPGGGSCVCRRAREWGRWETGRCGIWPFRYNCPRWRVIIETESCTVGPAAPAPPCPQGGPPGAGAGCASTYR